MTPKEQLSDVPLDEPAGRSDDAPLSSGGSEAITPASVPNTSVGSAATAKKEPVKPKEVKQDFKDVKQPKVEAKSVTKEVKPVKDANPAAVYSAKESKLAMKPVTKLATKPVTKLTPNEPVSPAKPPVRPVKSAAAKITTTKVIPEKSPVKQTPKSSVASASPAKSSVKSSPTKPAKSPERPTAKSPAKGAQPKGSKEIEKKSYSEKVPLPDISVKEATPTPKDSPPTLKEDPVKEPVDEHKEAKSVRLRSNTRCRSAANEEMTRLFIKNAFEKIKASKDAKRISALQAATDNVLDQLVRRPEVLPVANAVLEPLRLVCVPPGSSNELKEVALDTLGQLFSLNYFIGVENLLPDAVGIVCDAWDAEGADARVEVQIIKALTAAIVNEVVVGHGAVLMRAVRQVYHIFVVTRSQSNQSLAQVSLTQFVGAVFERAKLSSEVSESHDEVSDMGGMTLEDMRGPVPEIDENGNDDSGTESTARDAALLFRTLCLLSMKPVDEMDVRSENMRSKLLSLHLVHMILKGHISVFKNKNIVVRLSRSKSEPFAAAIKPYLRQMLAENALSHVPAAFEISAEIFWLLLANLRSEFKQELAVFFTEVYFTAMDLRTATMHQRLYFMTLVSRMCTDPRLLVELYLNYDCDPNAQNVFEKLMELVSRLALKPATEAPLTRMSVDRVQVRVYDLNAPPQLAISHLQVPTQPNQAQTDRDAYQLKLAALEAVVNMLRSLVLWSQRTPDEVNGCGEGYTQSTPALETTASGLGNPLLVERGHRPSSSTASLTDSDDPNQFAIRKKMKRDLDAAVQEFNFNARRGIEKFTEVGIIKHPEDPVEVARVLQITDGLDKATLGEYLGKNDEFNQHVLSEFINAMNYENLSIVNTLRRTLQRFRLPGEGQVVDRITKQIANKFFSDTSVDGTHPNFASADAAWVFMFSLMMLNTDLHAAATTRRRMTQEQFVKNNKGMNDGVDFREDLLLQCYEEIARNEIKLESEQQAQAIKDEAYDVATDAITTRASQFFKTAPLEFADYYNASNAAHIRPMFELCWMAVLAGVSNPFSQLTDRKALAACLEGFELALRVACRFDVAIARASFMQTVSQATLLSHPDMMQWKNLGAVKALLNVALTDGDSLRDSWYDMLLVISRLDQLQLVSRSVDVADRNSATQASSSCSSKPPRDIAEALQSLVVQLDRIFASTQSMSNEGAVDFVKALARVSLEEISRSRDSGEPRLFALQKMVDVCYYNSSRIRMGWSELWDAAMAEQFAKVLVDPNMQVVMFALDSLRQLSMRFLDIDEMPHFAFQQEFLQPFSHALRHNNNGAVRALVLECLTQMVLTRGPKLKSGWRAVFSAVQAAADSEDPTVVEGAYSLLKTVPTDTVPPGFLEACSAVAQQSEAKNALRAVTILKNLVESHPNNMDLWQQVFKVLTSVAMTGRDPEVRGESLTVLFGLLNKHGSQFSRADWEEAFNSLSHLFSVLYEMQRAAHTPRSSPSKPSGTSSPLRSPARSPIRRPSRNGSPVRGSCSRNDSRLEVSSSRLEVLSSQPNSRSVSPARNSPYGGKNTPSKSSREMLAADGAARKRSDAALRTRMREDMNLWLSTTLLQALKALIELFETYFDALEHTLDPFFLQLLSTCILDDNDTVSRMGVSCFEHLITTNVKRFTPEHWHLLVSRFVQLFKDSCATALIDRQLLSDPNAHTVFQPTISKTVQTLLIISCVRDLLVGSTAVFEALSVAEILRLTTRLSISYQFAHDFNKDSELRHELYERGLVRHVPNLLHQEFGAAKAYISISMRLFRDPDRFATDPTARQELGDDLKKLCQNILRGYNQLQQSEMRNVVKLQPIVLSIIRHINQFSDEDFREFVPDVYLEVINVLNKDMPHDIREQVQLTLRLGANIWVLPSVANLFGSKTGVRELSARTFTDDVLYSDKVSVIAFYAPWCGYCKQLQPELETAARQLKGVAKVSAVNCDKESNKKLCAKYNVKAFPTLKVFQPAKLTDVDFKDVVEGKDVPRRKPKMFSYQGERNAKALTEYAVNKLRNYAATLDGDDTMRWMAPNRVPRVIMLPGKKYKAKHLSPLFKVLSREYFGKMRFAMIPRRIDGSWNFMGLPAPDESVLVYLSDDKTPVMYKGSMKKGAIKAFLNEQYDLEMLRRKHTGGEPPIRDEAANGLEFVYEDAQQEEIEHVVQRREQAERELEEYKKARSEAFRRKGEEWTYSETVTSTTTAAPTPTETEEAEEVEEVESEETDEYDEEEEEDDKPVDAEVTEDETALDEVLVELTPEQIVREGPEAISSFLAEHSAELASISAAASRTGTSEPKSTPKSTEAGIKHYDLFVQRCLRTGLHCAVAVVKNETFKSDLRALVNSLERLPQKMRKNTLFEFIIADTDDILDEFVAELGVEKRPGLFFWDGGRHKLSLYDGSWATRDLAEWLHNAFERKITLDRRIPSRFYYWVTEEEVENEVKKESVHDEL